MVGQRIDESAHPILVYIGETVGETAGSHFQMLISINSIAFYGQLLLAHAHLTDTRASSGPGGDRYTAVPRVQVICCCFRQQLLRLKDEHCLMCAPSFSLDVSWE